MEKTSTMQSEFKQEYFLDHTFESVNYKLDTKNKKTKKVSWQKMTLIFAFYGLLLPLVCIWIMVKLNTTYTKCDGLCVPDQGADNITER